MKTEKVKQNAAAFCAERNRSFVGFNVAAGTFFNKDNYKIDKK